MSAVRILYISAVEDERFLDVLERHLAALRSEGLIDETSRRRLLPGVDIRSELTHEIARADLCIVLLSADLLASDECMALVDAALKRKQIAADTHMLTLLVRPADWEHSPLGQVQCLPSDQRPICLWPEQDEAWKSVAVELRHLVERRALKDAFPQVDIISESRGGATRRLRGTHRHSTSAVLVRRPGALPQTSSGEQALAVLVRWSRLHHPNLARIYDVQVLGRSVVLIEEDIVALELPGSQIAPQDALSLVRALLSGLQALHDAGILHGGIRPEACCRRRTDGTVVLTAPWSQPSISGGSSSEVDFLAPEVRAGGPASLRSDIYSLGATLLFFLGQNGAANANLHLTNKDAQSATLSSGLYEVRRDLPIALIQLIEQMVLYESARRPGSIAEALADLEHSRPSVRARIHGEPHAEPVAIGPWILGAQTYRSANWHAFAATHMHTGRGTRLSHLQAAGPMAQSGEQILRSAARAASLDHAGLLAVLDWGVAQGRPYVVTQPHGRLLREVISASGLWIEVDALALTSQIVSALQHLHEAGLAYQLVTPEAISLAADGRTAQLGWPMFCVPIGGPSADAGGKLQRAFVPTYAPPEALSGDASTIDAAVDLYGVGELLYFMLAGRSAFAGKNSPALLVEKQQPPDIRSLVPEVSAPTAALLRDLLAPSASARPASARVIHQTISRILQRLRGW